MVETGVKREFAQDLGAEISNDTDFCNVVYFLGNESVLSTHEIYPTLQNVESKENKYRKNNKFILHPVHGYFHRVDLCCGIAHTN